MRKYLCIISLFIIIIIEITIFTCYNNNLDQQYSYINIPTQTINAKENLNLMIVAHPDDETLWGGGSLLEKDYYVVCVTCGNVAYRDNEFKQIMAITNDSYAFLNYPDLVKGTSKISNWTNELELISTDLKNIIDSYNWQTIVTHNPDGEYGHIQHKKVSKLVTNLADKNKLYYFGKYYPNNVLETKMLAEDIYNRKINELISVYKSQPKAIKRHYHMLKYENFLQYYEW